ncbi:hypothetical protein [Parabacteroides sp.]
MKKEELYNEEHSKSVLNDPMAQYYTRINVPERVHEDIRIGIERADKGLLIPLEDVLARYK